MSNEQITAVCYLSINTVKTYIRSAYRKIGVSTRAQAVAWAMRNGFDIQH
ncbi:response regulator transcription factor [Calidifontibacter indicus]